MEVSSLGVCFRVWGLTCFGVFYMFLCVLCPFSISLHTFTHRKEFFLVRLANFFCFFCFHTCFCVFFVHFPSPCIHSRTEKSSFSSGRRIFFVFFSRSISWQRGILSRPGNGFVLNFFFFCSVLPLGREEFFRVWATHVFADRERQVMMM